MPSLFLIPTTLNPEIISAGLIPAQLSQIHHLQHFIVETAKIGRAHLKQLKLATPLQQLHIYELNKHKQDLSALIAPLKNNQDLGIISDCGCPAIADPGSRIVAIAHEMGINVVPLVGPSSILLTLMASGLNGQEFSFHGYLPAEPNARKARIKQLEQLIINQGSSHLFIEAPFRNQKLFEALLENLHGEIKICIGIDLMTQQEQIITKSVQQWRRKSLFLDKQEVLFIIGRA